MHEKLDDLPRVIVLRDDILVVGHGATPEEVERNHDENLKRLLERARQENLKFNKDKIKFKQTEVKFMSHLITKEGLKADPDKVKAIKEMKRPESKQETLTLLSFINYRSHIPSEIVTRRFTATSRSYQRRSDIPMGHATGNSL